MKEKVYGTKKSRRHYYISIPDNEDSFFAYINLVINNKNNAHIPEYIEQRPKKIGPVYVEYVRGEMNEPFMRVENNKDATFLEMIKDQFCLLRSHWNMIQSLERYPNASRY